MNRQQNPRSSYPMCAAAPWPSAATPPPGPSPPTPGAAAASAYMDGRVTISPHNGIDQSIHGMADSHTHPKTHRGGVDERARRLLQNGRHALLLQRLPVVHGHAILRPAAAPRGVPAQMPVDLIWYVYREFNGGHPFRSSCLTLRATNTLDGRPIRTDLPTYLEKSTGVGAGVEQVR